MTYSNPSTVTEEASSGDGGRRLAQLRANWAVRTGSVHNPETLFNHAGAMLNHLEGIVTVFALAIDADIRRSTVQHMIDELAKIAKTSSALESRYKEQNNVGG